MSRGKSRKQIYNHIVVLLTWTVAQRLVFISCLVQYAIIHAFLAALRYELPYRDVNVKENGVITWDIDNSSESFH